MTAMMVKVELTEDQHEMLRRMLWEHELEGSSSQEGMELIAVLDSAWSAAYDLYQAKLLAENEAEPAGSFENPVHSIQDTHEIGPEGIVFVDARSKGAST